MLLSAGEADKAERILMDIDAPELPAAPELRAADLYKESLLAVALGPFLRLADENATAEADKKRDAVNEWQDAFPAQTLFINSFLQRTVPAVVVESAAVKSLWIVDFDIGNGYKWVDAMKRLGETAPPVSVKLTAVHLPSSPRHDREHQQAFTDLTNYAKKVGLGFEFGVERLHGRLPKELLSKAGGGEAVIVYLPAAAAAAGNELYGVMDFLTSSRRPNLVLVGEKGGLDSYELEFAEHLSQAIRWSTSRLKDIDDAVTSNVVDYYSTHEMETYVERPMVDDMVDVRRRLGYKPCRQTWRRRFLDSGFWPVKIEEMTVDKVAAAAREGYVVKKRCDGEAVLLWMRDDTELMSLSAWH